MSENIEVGGTGNYSDFEDLLKIYRVASKRLPTGISFKRDTKKTGIYLSFQFVLGDKRITRVTGCDFSEIGFVQALDKAVKIRHALDTITSVAQFDEWYENTILGKNQIIDDRITYREIFSQIEAKYFNGRNKNTKHKRNADSISNCASYNNTYAYVFKRFSDWDKQPNWEDIKVVLFSWEQGTKSFKDSYSVIKKIISYCPNADKMLALMSDIDFRQTEFKEKQSISLEQFLEWHDIALYNGNERYQENRESWLWVASMCVVYGLRPSEIAAAQNLTKPYTKDGVTIPALNSPNNHNLLLVLGDKTYFGVTIKTGSRVCKPMTTDKKLLERLNIQKPKLPEYQPDISSKANSIVDGFSNSFRTRIKSWKCPVSQAYAFRHLSNQLGEKYGIPQEIRSRSLGHSVAVNESTYKKRSNFQTSVDLLTNHSKQPLSLDMAINQLVVCQAKNCEFERE
jgi:integrase